MPGIQVGVGLAYNNSRVENDSDYTYCVVTSRKSVRDDMPFNIDKRRSNFDPSFNVGYSVFKGKWYLGASGEISFGKNRRKYEVFYDNYTARTETAGFSSTFKFKGGYCFNKLNAVVYGIAGLKWRNIETRVDFKNGQVSLTGSKTKLKNPHYILGFGFERPLRKKMSLSVEYEYAWNNTNGTTTLRNGGNSWGCHFKQKLKEHSFKLGIKYRV